MLGELLTVVVKTDAGLVAQGCVSRDLAHSPLRIPHTSALLVPYRKGTRRVVLHVRSMRKKTSPCKLDFAGGHVPFELAALQGPEGFAKCIDRTALREAREEVLVSANGRPYVLPRRSVARFTPYGALEADCPENREFSTGYVVELPDGDGVQFAMVDENPDGETVPLQLREEPIERVLGLYEEDPEAFADGAARVLKAIQDPQSETAQEFFRIVGG